MVGLSTSPPREGSPWGHNDNNNSNIIIIIIIIIIIVDHKRSSTFCGVWKVPHSNLDKGMLLFFVSVCFFKF